MAKSVTKKPAAEILPPENGEAKLPAVLEQSFAAPTNVKVKKHVTIPVLKWPENTSIVFMAVEAIKRGKEIEEKNDGQPKRRAVDVLVISSPDGELRQLVCGEVFKKELQSGYPKDTYVNKWFLASKIAPPAERVAAAKARGINAYATYSIQEIEKP